MGFIGFILFADIFILEFISEKLNRVIIMTKQLIISVNLIGESALLNSCRITAPSLISSTGVSQ